jgi:hypothetical protein
MEATKVVEQVVTAVEKAGQEASQSISKIDIPARVFDFLDAIAKKTGTTAEYVWPELVKYTYAEALSGLILILFFFGLSCLLSFVFVKRASTKLAAIKNDFTDGDAFLYLGPCILSAIMLLFSSIALATSFSRYLSRVIAPEGATIYQVLESLKG